MEIFRPNKRIEGGFDRGASAKCSNGTFVGTRKGSLLVYRGIPFACPPTGALRWKKPVPAPDGDGVFEAKYNGRTPVQTEWPTERA
ncbi:MAG: carboxylesterase family protein, partial [Clostridia bacterium]|nr:carboxylesterase family protein [Clostridia bacterium]